MTNQRYYSMFKRSLFVLLFFFLLCNKCVFANPVKEMYTKATEAYMKKDFVKAVEYYEKTNAMYPGLPQSYNYLALAKKALGHPSEEVIAVFNKAIELNPQYAECYDNVAKVYYAMAEFKKSVEYSLKALEINPDFVSARLSLAWTYLLGMVEPIMAAEQFHLVTDSHNVAIAHFGLGLAYFMDGEKFRVLEMITSLRHLNEDEYAQQLEVMLNSGSFIPPRINGVPLIAPQKQRGVLVSDRAALSEGLSIDAAQKDRERNSRDGQMKVRLVDPSLQQGMDMSQESYPDPSQGRGGQGRGLSF